MDHAPPTLTGVCGSDPGISCRMVWDLSHNVRAAQLTEIYLSGPIHLLLRLALAVVLALAIRAMLHRLINRITERAAVTFLPQFRGPLPGGRLVAVRLLRWRKRPSARPAGVSTVPPAASEPVADETVARVAVRPDEAAAGVEVAMIDERRHQRVRALGQILRSASSVTIFAIAGLVMLGDLGINLAPLLASAGVAGIAIGFGAQNLVRDYLTGIFILLEDQYGVGDAITVGKVTGTVETMTLRITRLRDINGVVWHIRNGTIDRVGNQSQGWARAVVDFPVPYTADLGTIRAILADVADSAWSDPALRAFMLEKPEVWGAQDVSSSEVTMRLVARTAPLRQWETERELRARVKAALDAAGIFPAPAPDSGG
ncbi:MAG TPA: mechanosensitive ion channel family protein [Trebonia sp.]|nr:mechanosensitive ion channel family protein [Trebonia sp.]